MRYAHRNGEREAPEEEGWYWCGVESPAGEVWVEVAWVDAEGEAVLLRAVPAWVWELPRPAWTWQWWGPLVPPLNK